MIAVALLAFSAFGFGFVSSLHLKSTSSIDLRHQYLLQTGDAPPAVRAGVLAALRSFQDGYVRRDPRELGSFMHHLFPEDGDILLLGTDAGEWVRGYPAVAEFIRTDWLKWGDFRFAVDDSIIWSSGDVAWIASVGVVHDQWSDRPVRFSATLMRSGPNWLFRELHFQWDDRDARASDLFRPSTHLRIARLVMHYIRRVAGSTGTSRSSVISQGSECNSILCFSGEWRSQTKVTQQSTLVPMQRRTVGGDRVAAEPERGQGISATSPPILAR